ncbi:hypothetical protein Peur_006511 [Populus x canadensis]
MQYLFITRASSIIPPSSTAKEDIFEYPQPVLDMEAMPPEAIEVSARESQGPNNHGPGLLGHSIVLADDPSVLP